MKIIHRRPPNFQDIIKVFPMAAGAGVLFAYHDAIYYPAGQPLPQYMLDHEAVHLRRQGGTEEGARAWWDKYLTDPDFRYIEELLAHRAEYKSMIENATTRQLRKHALRIVAKKLAAPLYGWRLNVKQCEKDLLACDSE